MLAIDNGGLSLHCVPDISYHPPGHLSGLTLPFKAIDSSRGAFEKETEHGSTQEYLMWWVGWTQAVLGSSACSFVEKPCLEMMLSSQWCGGVSISAACSVPRIWRLLIPLFHLCLLPKSFTLAPYDCMPGVPNLRSWHDPKSERFWPLPLHQRRTILYLTPGDRPQSKCRCTKNLVWNYL